MNTIFKSLEFRCIIGILACLYFLSYGRVHIEDVILHRGFSEKQIKLPISQNMGIGERFSVSFVVSNPLNLPYDLNIIPDDCAESIVINGFHFSLNDYPDKCNFGKGFWLKDSVTALHRVGNRTHYEIFLMNNGGIAGINIFPKDSFFISSLEIIIAFLIGLILASVARRFRWNTFLLLCIIFGTFLRFAMFYAMPYTQFAYDVEGHLAYVQYIADNHSIPEAKDCWTCYHPPVYYTSAVPSFLLSGLIGYASSSGVQAFSLALSIILLLCGLALLKRIVSGYPLQIASLLWTVWPTLLLVAPRIGNDQMFYTLHILCLLCGFNYIKCGKGKFLIIAIISAALAIWTKSTGYVTFGLAILFTLIGFIKTNQFHRPSKAEITAWVLLSFTLAGIALEKMVGNHVLVANATSLHSGLRVGIEAQNYLYFDLRSFLTEPYTSGWVDGLGREYFINYAFKSSLFGEFNLVEPTTGRTLASILSLSFLALIAFAVRGWWKTKLDVYHWILLIQGIAFFAALAYLRYKYPYACSNDFRYIIPVLSSFIPYVGLGVYQQGYSQKWKVLGTITVMTFAFCSVSLMSYIFS
ncbi:MAG: glycosyltransferase family 39 protein [Fibrobacter sp.]|nr:glycosyltransferase family 39 protein [Fibrobacter sp.]